MSSGYKFMYKFIQAAWINEVRFTIRINQASFNIGYWGQNSFWRFICHSGLRYGYKIYLIHRFNCGQRCRMPNIILAGSTWPENILFFYFLNLLLFLMCLFVCFWITLGDASKRDMLTFTTLCNYKYFFSHRKQMKYFQVKYFPPRLYLAPRTSCHNWDYGYGQFCTHFSSGYKINLIHRLHCGQRCGMPNIILAGSAWPEII